MRNPVMSNSESKSRTGVIIWILLGILLGKVLHEVMLNEDFGLLMDILGRDYYRATYLSYEHRHGHVNGLYYLGGVIAFFGLWIFNLMKGNDVVSAERSWKRITRTTGGTMVVMLIMLGLFHLSLVLSAIVSFIVGYLLAPKVTLDSGSDLDDAL